MGGRETWQMNLMGSPDKKFENHCSMSCRSATELLEPGCYCMPHILKDLCGILPVVYLYLYLTVSVEGFVWDSACCISLFVSNGAS